MANARMNWYWKPVISYFVHVVLQKGVKEDSGIDMISVIVRGARLRVGLHEIMGVDRAAIKIADSAFVGLQHGICGAPLRLVHAECGVQRGSKARAVCRFDP